jgi:hypothetical protein
MSETGGGGVVALFLPGWFDIDTSSMQKWLRSASSWAGDQLEGAAHAATNSAAASTITAYMAGKSSIKNPALSGVFYASKRS